MIIIWHEISDKMKLCHSCQQENPPQAKFCNSCGARFNASGNGDQIAVQGEGKSFERSAERRQLTILFCDLVGSTNLSEKLDPEEYRQVIIEYHQVAEKVY